MLAAVMSLVGVLVGAILALGAVWLIDQRHTHRHDRRQIRHDKQEAYHRVLRSLDDLLGMRPDHPDIGLTVRTLTAQITELQLIAPPVLADLASQCVAFALQPGADPAWAAHVRGQFALAAHADLDPVTIRPAGVVEHRTDQRGARHAVARRVR